MMMMMMMMVIGKCEKLMPKYNGRFIHGPWAMSFVLNGMDNGQVAEKVWTYQ